MVMEQELIFTGILSNFTRLNSVLEVQIFLLQQKKHRCSIYFPQMPGKLPFTGHSSQYHQRPVPSVLRFSSDFHHYFISMNGANPENFSFKTFPYQFLLVFKNLEVSVNSWHFMKLGFKG